MEFLRLVRFWPRLSALDHLVFDHRKHFKNWLDLAANFHQVRSKIVFLYNTNIPIKNLFVIAKHLLKKEILFFQEDPRDCVSGKN